MLHALIETCRLVIPTILKLQLQSTLQIVSFFNKKVMLY